MSKELKKFIIVTDTNLCGTKHEYAAEAEKEEDLYELAEELAYDIFESYGGYDEMCGEYDEYGDPTFEESDYYNWYVQEVLTEDDNLLWQELEYIEI